LLAILGLFVDATLLDFSQIDLAFEHVRVNGVLYI
jgi:hypothetical protein